MSCKALLFSESFLWVSLKDMQHELEQLTKELRQVNLQQFIKQTGTKVTVLPAEPTDDESAHNSHSIGNENFLQIQSKCVGDLTKASGCASYLSVKSHFVLH